MLGGQVCYLPNEQDFFYFDYIYLSNANFWAGNKPALPALLANVIYNKKGLVLSRVPSLP